MSASKTSLRQQLKLQRSQLSAVAREQASKAITALIVNSSYWQSATKIASYMAVQGELDLSNLHQLAWKQGKQLFLPVLDAKKLRFAVYSPDSTMHLNAYGIAEPCMVASTLYAADQLDLLVIPLLGFDEKGYRLGMGKGYYDRTLSPLRKIKKRPFFMGAAFTCQLVASLPIDIWDVPLDVVATEEGFVFTPGL
ncbi:MAG: 5-formyltetrahydrofolate cyclo-ligase [Gammaproteobacteria bacterium]|nr:5-formyltetrahydrofolate cyclo-ligase [Gammaproteobacteria bacterium]